MNARERIMHVTGRKPTACRCPVCQSYCQTPCLGTPQDILRLLDAGYAPQLSLTYWAVGMLVGVIERPFLMVQLLGRTEGCVLFRDGRCELHELGLKPTEGRLSHHILTEENLSFEKSLSWNIAKEWLRKDNEPTVASVFESFQAFKTRTGK